MTSKVKIVEGCSKEQMLRRFKDSVKIIAQQVARSRRAQHQLDDLVSAGWIGLMDAFDKYDSQLGSRFKTYAEFRIRGAMLDELRAQTWWPRSALDKVKIVDSLHARMQARHGRRATDDEVRAATGFERSQVSYPGCILNLEDYRQFSVNDREALKSLGEGVDPFLQAHQTKTRETLERATAHLPERQRAVIRWIYFEGLNSNEAARRLGVSPSRITQLHQEAMRFLRRDEDMQALLMSLYRDLAA